jgi:hypothetical protein
LKTKIISFIKNYFLEDRLDREIGELVAMPENGRAGIIQWQPFGTCLYLNFFLDDILNVRSSGTNEKNPVKLGAGDRVEFYHARERNRTHDKKVAKFIIPARVRRYQVNIYCLCSGKFLCTTYLCTYVF